MIATMFRFVSLLPIALVFALASCQPVYAHPIAPDECGFYAGVAKRIADAKNSGESATDVVPALMSGISACTAKGTCPVKDGEDSKRLMDFVRQVYALDNKEPIDSDAVAQSVFEQCQAATKLHDETMTPDPSVPITGKQIES